MESTAVGVNTLGTGPMASSELREATEGWPRPLSTDLVGGTEPGLDEVGIGTAGRCWSAEQSRAVQG